MGGILISAVAQCGGVNMVELAGAWASFLGRHLTRYVVPLVPGALVTMGLGVGRGAPRALAAWGPLC